MVIPFELAGVRVVIPSVYSTLLVQSSIPSSVPAGKSILILGESEEGIPGNLMDLKLNYFTDFPSVRDFYKSGPICDAARTAFSPQPNPVFGGAVQRLYVWKTNQTTQASKTISSPANYGSLVASRFGEDGNMIKSQIKKLNEVSPSKSFVYLPSYGTSTLKISVNGVVSSLSMSAIDVVTGAGCATQLATLLAAVSGVTTAAVPPVALISIPGDVAITSLSDVLTITAAGASPAVFNATIKKGDIVVIPVASALKGAANANSGVYVAEQDSTASTLVIRQLKRFSATAEAASVAFDLTAVLGVDVEDCAAFGPITVHTAQNVVGSGASFEISSSAGHTDAIRMVSDISSLSDLIRAQDVGVGRISASAVGLTLNVSLSSAQWVATPKVGDLVKIGRGSVIAGTLANVGLWAVVSSTSQTLSLINSHITPVSVSSVLLAADAIESSASFVSSTLIAKKVSSASEAQAWIVASDTKNNISFPTTKAGGVIYLEVGYNDGAATACSLSIDGLRNMVITPVGGGSVLTIKLNKYKSLQNLADFISSKAGYTAIVPITANKSLPTSVLDAVSSLGILGAHSSSSTNGKLKGDYYLFTKLISDNFGLISFKEGSMALKAGLPAAESVASYLSGAVVGGTSDADVQAGLDAALRIDAQQVVPLFSRDAIDDVSDGLTDDSSSYSIDSIHAAVKAHVAAASTIKVKRRRFGMLSIHESFENSKEKIAVMSYERLQMTFEMVRATDSDGALQWYLPWMAAMVIATGRAQAGRGTSMLRKTFGVSAVKHIGKKSVYDDTLVQDFDPEDQGQMEEAITAGLLTLRAVTGFGIRMESPDSSTRSRENDPQGWVWERVNVLTILDDVQTQCETTLDNFIGERQSDVSTAVVSESLSKILRGYITDGSLLAFSVDSVVKVGTGYKAAVRVQPTESLEFIGLTVLAERSTT
jgi:hypothetical protein